MMGLDGIRILDLTHFIAGPYCAQLLADMGADVIKIERPGVGEAARSFGPYEKEESLYYTSYNRNKRGITLNLRSEKGKQIFLEMVKKSDILIENQRPGFMKKLGLSYEELSVINPQLIMASISGFGQNGPYKDWPALDMIVQAMGGIMDMTGFPDGPPTKAGFAVVDFATGVYTALGIMVALYVREKTGRGQYIDVAMLDSIFTFLENFPAANKLQGYKPCRVGNSRVVTGPSNAYKAKDGYVYIAAVANAHFQRLMDLIGKPELGTDPKYATPYQRKQAQDFLDSALTAWTSNFTVEEILKMVQGEAVPCGPVNSIEKLVSDPQIIAREMMVEADHPTVGKIAMIGNPIKLSETPVQIRFGPPTLGQHNEEVLDELLGFASEEIGALKEEGII